MMNLTITRDCRIFTSKGHELDQKVRFPLRVHSPVHGRTAICKDREALAAFLKAHIDAIPRCFYTVEELLGWMLEEDAQIRVAVSRHDVKVRQMLDESCIFLG